MSVEILPTVGETSPYGGQLLNLLASTSQARELNTMSSRWPSWGLTARQTCDLELLLNGGFSPLDGFMTRDTYESVCHTMRLPNGLVWPIPITLDVTEDFGSQLEEGSFVALRDAEGVLLAALHVDDVWLPDREMEAVAVYGTTDRRHPGVAYLLDRTGAVYVGGSVAGFQLPAHYDFRELRLTPAEVRDTCARAGWTKVVAFQTRNPMHRAHVELTRRASAGPATGLLLHPAVGLTKPGDVDHYTRVRCYRAVMSKYPPGSARLALLPLAMRMAGPREAVWHAIIRKNFGCTHLIVGRDHAGPGADRQGRPFYAAYAAQQLLGSVEHELGITMIPSQNLVYVDERVGFVPEDQVPEGARATSLSGTRLRELLAQGAEIPHWFTFDEVARELRRRHLPRRLQGFTVFMTGLSGAGKSTIANILLSKLLERGGRQITLLDGDHVRQELSAELGFSKAHRDLNIRRIGFVAAEITKNGGIAICAPIAPYDDTRRAVRALIEAVGGFVLVHVAAPLEVCERRDRKGLYAKARAGLIDGFTGVSDPYQRPHDAEIVVDSVETSPESAADGIIEWLEKAGFLEPEASCASATDMYARSSSPVSCVHQSTT